MVEVTKPILSVSYLCEHGIETHLAGQPFLKCGERHKPLIKKSGVYSVKAQIVHDVKGTVESCAQAGESQNSCVRADAYELKKHKSHAYDLMDCKTHKSRVYELKIHKNSQKSCVRVDGLQNSKKSF